MLEMEDQPAELMMLPYWTESVLAILGDHAAKSIRAGLKDKVAALTAARDDYQEQLGTLFDAAEKRLDSRHFSAFQITPDAPYLSWTKAQVPVRAVQVCRPNNVGDIGADICRVERRPDQEWAQRQSQHVSQLVASRAAISPIMEKLKAITPPLLLLEEYLRKLPDARGGALPEHFVPPDGIVFTPLDRTGMVLELFTP